MSEERNSDFSRRQERRDRRAKLAIEQRNFRQRQREEKIAWIKAARKRQHHQDFQEGKEWFGIFIILIGLVWLGKPLFGSYPEWLFSWQSLMIAVGLALGFASRFRNKASYILILVALAFMTKEYILPDKDLGAFIWPLIIIGVGILFIIKKREHTRLHKYMRQHPEEFEDWRARWQKDCAFWHGDREKKFTPGATDAPSDLSNDEEGAENKNSADIAAVPIPDLDDWLDITNVLSGTRRTVISKQFKGGEVENILGGIELDLSRSDISGTITLNITNIMGGIQLGIPPNWQVTYNCTCIMGGTDDRRRSGHQHDPNKCLILTGTVIMGGIEVRDLL